MGILGHDDIRWSLHRRHAIYFAWDLCSDSTTEEGAGNAHKYRIFSLSMDDI